MQILNDPLLDLVGREAFVRYERAHNRRFGWVVLPGVAVAGVAMIGLSAEGPGAFRAGRRSRSRRFWWW
jgi:hypothetical protein